MARPLSICQGCGRPLDFSRVHEPRFGLAPVNCSNCQHRHLYSPAELLSARDEMLLPPSRRMAASVKLQLRRLWTA